MLFPPCEAVIEQVPAATGVTLFDETVQTDPELLVSVTASPEEALDVRV